MWQDIFQKGRSGLKFLEIHLGMSQIFKGGFPRDEVGVNVGDFFREEGFNFTPNLPLPPRKCL